VIEDLSTLQIHPASVRIKMERNRGVGTGKPQNVPTHPSRPGYSQAPDPSLVYRMSVPDNKLGRFGGAAKKGTSYGGKRCANQIEGEASNAANSLPREDFDNLWKLDEPQLSGGETLGRDDLQF